MLQGFECYVCDVIQFCLNFLCVILIYFILLHVLETRPFVVCVCWIGHAVVIP